jgi:hypothetical protein
LGFEIFGREYIIYLGFYLSLFDKTSMAFFVLVLLILALFLIPVWMRGLFRRSALGSSNLQVGVLICFEICLALAVFLSFFCAWFSYWVMVHHVVEWATGLNTGGVFWDEFITPKHLMVLLIIIGVPLALFFKVGILTIRDVHQICKEQRDRVKKRHELGTFWKGF